MVMHVNQYKRLLLEISYQFSTNYIHHVLSTSTSKTELVFAWTVRDKNKISNTLWAPHWRCVKLIKHWLWVQVFVDTKYVLLASTEEAYQTMRLKLLLHYSSKHYESCHVLPDFRQKNPAILCAVSIQKHENAKWLPH